MSARHSDKTTIMRVYRETHEIVSGIAYEQDRTMIRQLHLIVYEWCLANGYTVPDRLRPDPALMWEE